MGDNAYKQRHREQGLCTNCSRLALPFKDKCAEHEYSHNESCKKNYWNNPEKRRIKRREDIRRYLNSNRCRTCSKPLDPDADEGHVVCMNCRSSAYIGALKCR